MFYIGIEGAGGIDIMSKLSKKVCVSIDSNWAIV